MTYDTYLFDLYGTLIDIHTNERKLALWGKMALYLSMQGAHYEPKALRKKYQTLDKKQRIELAKSYSDKLQETFLPNDAEIQIDDVFRLFFTDKGITVNDQQMKDFATFFRVTSMEYMRLFDQVTEVLTALKAQGKKLYLLSNAQRLFTDPEVKTFGLDQIFDDIFYSSDYGFKKPSPHFYDIPFQKYELDKARAVMVGNEAHADILGAAQYGIHGILYNTTPYLNEGVILPPDCPVITSLTELL